jgi:biotin operon repressor
MTNVLPDAAHVINSASAVNSCVARAAAIGLIVASAGFGAVYAWSTASTHGPLLAALAVLMAVSLDVIKPAAVVAALAAFRSLAIVRGALLTLLALVAVAYSLSAELSLFAKARTDSIAERVDHAQRVGAAVALRKRTAADLAALDKPNRTSAEVRAYVASTRQGTKARADIEAELARAESYEGVKVRLDAAQDVLAELGGVKVADPGASALAGYLAALGVNVDPARLTDMLVLCGVLALEVGSALGMLVCVPMGRVPNVPLEGRAQQTRFADAVVTPSVGMTTAPIVRPAQTSVFPSVVMGDHPLTTADQSARSKVLALVLASGGSLRAGHRDLAAQLGVSKTAVAFALRGLRDDGVLTTRAGATGTTLTLAATAGAVY